MLSSSKVTTVFLVCLGLLGLYGCSKTADFDISISPETLEVEVGTQTALEVTIDRKSLSEDTPIYLALDNPPQGLSASDVILTGTTGFFMLSASQSGDFSDLKLKASTDTLSKTVLLDVTAIDAQGFKISANPSQLTLNPSVPGLIKLQVNRISIGNTPVRVRLKNTPAGVTADDISITGDSGNFRISSNEEVTLNLILLATAGDFSKEIPITLQVTSQPSFSLDAEPDNLPLNAGTSSTALLYLSPLNGFNQAVQVEAGSLPAGVSANPSTIPAGATEGTLIFVANADAPRGVYPVTLTATSAGGIVRDNTINLNISNAGGGNTLVKETVVTGLEVPWDLSFTPDGTLYFTERKGNFKKVVNGNVVNLSHPLNVHAETEAGLMGIDFDPSYPSEPYLYACYSYLDTSGIKNRVSRLTVGQNSLSNERILIDAIPGSTNHDGCRLIFGPDNKLYITMGDARVAANAQSVNSLSGKILRINRDGSIPSDNPFLGSQVWSYGHRNAQGLAFHSNGRLYSSEHGDASEDEVNRIIPGANYGWPYVEGRCNTTTEQIECNSRNLQEPLTVYAPTLGVSGLAFYDKDMFPEWNGNLLLASLKAGQLYRIILDSEGRAVNEEILINQDYGRLRDVEVAPDGSIYIAVSNRDNRAFPPFPKPVDDRIIRWSMQ